MYSTAFLLWSVVFSSIGIGYFIYGKKQMKLPALVGGVALLVYPYVVTNTYALVGLGAVFVAIPFLLEF